MHKKTAQRIWMLLILAVVIFFGIFMVVTVPEVNTVEEVEQVEDVESN